MQQLALFDAEARPQTLGGKASVDVAPVPSAVYSFHDQVAENSHVQVAIDNGWWSNALALIRHKNELHQQIRSEMILAAEDRCPGLGEIRHAVRLIADRIAGLIDGPLDNEHVTEARKAGWWGGLRNASGIPVRSPAKFGHDSLSGGAYTPGGGTAAERKVVPAASSVSLTRLCPPVCVRAPGGFFSHLSARSFLYRPIFHNVVFTVKNPAFNHQGWLREHGTR
ncbi:TPA: hypothetical protein ACYLN4_005658 [Burkholderia lata]